ncbi:hypothetical protein C0J52_00609 [Blattella germanica]|nr:hypothetical protein C0J52_00609 [Blattella germanica]
MFLRLVLLLLPVLGLELPSYIKPCPRNDPNLDECIFKNGQEAVPFIIKGDPEYGLFVMDPWHPKDLRIKELGLSLVGFNMSIVGYKGGHLDSVKTDPSKNKVTIKYRVPEILFTGKYDMNGRLVAIPVRGNGDFVVNMYDTVIKYTTEFKVVRKGDGEEYAVPQSYEFLYAPGDMKMNLTNLFGGNKLIGDVMNKFMNDNWRAVMEEAGKPSSRAVGQEVHQLTSIIVQQL